MSRNEKEMELRVSKITVETPDTKTFRFDLGPHKPFQFIPGQYVILSTDLWNPRKQRMGIVHRAFSIASSPLEKDYIEITAKRYPEGRMTGWLHDTVQVGQGMTVQGPKGEFVYEEGKSDELILIAGGIGIAPFRSMTRYVLARELPVQIRLFYTARTPGDFAFKPEFEDAARRYPNFHCIFTVTREHGGWAGRVGRVDRDLLRPHVTNPNARFYLCGPDPMIRDLRQVLEELSVAISAIFAEKW